MNTLYKKMKKIWLVQFAYNGLD